MRRPRSLPSQYKGGPSRRPTPICSDAAVRAQTPGSGTFGDTNLASTQWRFSARLPSFCLAAVWKTKTSSISHDHKQVPNKMIHVGDETALLMDQLLEGDRWVFCSLKIDASAISSSSRRPTEGEIRRKRSESWIENLRHSGFKRQTTGRS